jgi:sensor c-di-GMP phosphodiesterase-like protein
MHGRIGFGLIALAALVTLAVPPWLAYEEAQREAYSAESEQVRRFALDVLHRVDETTRQIDSGLRLLQETAYPPCAERSLGLMRQIDLGSTYLQAVGYTDGGRIVCSSMGVVPLGLGKDVVRTSSGFALYPNVPVSSPGQSPLLAVERGRFVALVHRGLLIDAWIDAPGVSLGILYPQDQRVVVARGHVDPAWLQRLGTQRQVIFADGRHLVSAAHSRGSLFAVVVAVPLAQVERRAGRIAGRLVPAGALGGLALAVAILLLGRRQLSMEAALRSALRRDEFFMCYQPIIDLQTGQWVGAEALLRWRRADGALVGPDLFIPVAEESKLITQLTERVLQLIGRDAGHFLAAHPAFHVAVNLSAEDLQSADTVKHFAALLERCGAHPSNVIVEITERGFLNLSSAREILSALRERGIEVAIDDFGTGYSSLSYLESLDLDFLKIDRSFIEAIGTGAPISQVVAHIIAMARSMGLRMIAEGIESEAQADFVRERRVEYAQGFLFGRPMPFAELVQRFNDREKMERPPAPAVSADRG